MRALFRGHLRHSWSHLNARYTRLESGAWSRRRLFINHTTHVCISSYCVFILFFIGTYLPTYLYTWPYGENRLNVFYFIFSSYFFLSVNSSLLSPFLTHTYTHIHDHPCIIYAPLYRTRPIWRIYFHWPIRLIIISIHNSAAARIRRKEDRKTNTVLRFSDVLFMRRATYYIYWYARYYI